jgi:hypothetical protein
LPLPKTVNLTTHSCGVCARNFQTRSGKWKHEKHCKDTPTIWNKGNASDVSENIDIIETSNHMVWQEMMVVREELIVARQEMIVARQEIITAQQTIIKQLIELIATLTNSCNSDEDANEMVRKVNEMVRKVNEMGLKYKLVSVEDTNYEDECLKTIVRFEKSIKIEKGSHRIRELIKNVSEDADIDTLIDVMKWVNINPTWHKYLSSDDSNVSSDDRFRAQCVDTFKRMYTNFRVNQDIEQYFKQSWLFIVGLWKPTKSAGFGND